MWRDGGDAVSRLSHPPVSVKRAVIERDGGWCIYMLPGCMGEATTTDHRANRGSGGSRELNDPVNLAAICVRCNSSKADAGSLVLLDLEERGLWVRKAATNTETLERARAMPVQYPDGEFFYLVDEHTRRHVSEGRPGDG